MARQVQRSRVAVSYIVAIMHALRRVGGWRSPQAVVGILLVGLLGACGANSAPQLDQMDEQIAAVGQELTIQLRASDADNDEIRYDYNCAELVDLAARPLGPSIESFQNGLALFRWIPQADDVRPEPYQFDFIVSDGKSESRRSTSITVRSQGGSGAPVFVRPIGSGTTLELDNNPCVELAIEVLDTDSTSTELGQEAPLIEGATLEKTGPFTGLWQWCPSPEQLQVQDRFYLRLSADDGENPKTVKLPPYLIVVVGSGKGDNCPGTGPVITHTAMSDQNTVQDLKIAFSVTDDQGLKSTPLLYWASTDPGSPPSLSAMTPVMTTRKSGDALSGTYEGVIPNPVASSPSGTQKTLYYQLVARDNDDPTGGCNHTRFEPDLDRHEFVVTNTGGEGGLAACAACTSDTQCGDASDHCITIGGALRCGVACTGSGGCPAGYTCTAAAVTSIDGTSAKQCIPTAGSCAATQSCTDDSFEQNDGMNTITNTAAQSLAPMSYPNLMLCPLPSGDQVDEDWFGIPVTQEGKIEVVLTSSATTDIDLTLVGEDGALLDASLSFSSNETVSACVRAGAGKLYARVYSPSTTPSGSPYSLTLTKTAMTCACQPDAREPDDLAGQATPLGRPTAPRGFLNLSLCPNNSDWFATTLNAGDTLVVDLVFNQLDFNGDLDIHLFRADAVTDLFPCSPSQPGCAVNNGQSADSDEHMEWTVPAGQGGIYYVVVRGYDATDTNSYSMTVRVQ